jgi:Tol biopolymer transport system component
VLPNPDGIPRPPSYSFIGSSEVVLTDPFFYIMKYYLTIAEAGSINAKNIEPEIKESFSKIQRPDIDHIISPKLISEDLLYVFIGYRNNTQGTYLYVLDLYEKKFKLLNENVKTYRLSPDRKKIAYIKTNKGTPGSDTLITINTDGTDKNELVHMPHITGLEWSHSGGWIALSAGEKGDCDINIIKSDGTHKEQLTHGMNPSGKLSWSYTGDKIAFTSGEGKPSPESRVYIIKLNIEDTSKIARSEPRNLERVKMSKLLIETLRKETDTLIDQSKKDS